MAEKSFWNEKKDKEWVSNFFFYYTKHIIASVLVVIFLIFGINSCMNQIHYDMEMYYLSSSTFDASVFDALKNELSKVVDDIDGKQGTQVLVNDFSFNDEDVMNAQYNATMNMKIQAEFSNGKGYLYIVDEYWLNFCLENEIFQDISKYTGDENTCYYVEITDNSFLNSLGMKSDKPLYAGLRVPFENRKTKEIETNRYTNAAKAIQYIIENK